MTEGVSVEAIDLGNTSRAAIFLEAMIPFIWTESRLFPIDLEYLISLAKEDVLL